MDNAGNAVVVAFRGTQPDELTDLAIDLQAVSDPWPEAAGSVHGGFALTLMDSCMSCAVQTMLKQGEIYTTLELKVNLVRAITKDTGLIRATGRLIHRGRTTGTAEGDVRDTTGNLLAHGTTTCMIFPGKK